jgi:glycosyltransferase involved in cell wall biosynthesis
MNVLHLISTIGFFGAEKVVIQLSKELVSLHCKPYIGIISNSKNQFESFAENAKRNNVSYKIFFCNGKFDLKSIIEIRNFIKNSKIGIIHSHGYKSNFYSLLANLNLGCKRITTCHLWKGKSLKMNFYNGLDKFLLRKFDKVIAVSDNLEKTIIQNGVSKHKVAVINNGIEVTDFIVPDTNASMKRSLGLYGNEKIIGAIGVLSEEKGHIYLLKAFANVILEFPNVKLLIVGDGPLKNTLQATSYKLQLKDKVIFTGIRNDIPSLLNIMNIFVMPSLDEGMPMALLEAMAAQKPIVATKVGAVPKLIENKKTGLLIEPKDADAIANSIISLLRDEEMKRTIAINAFQKVKNEFSSSIMAQKYSEVYKDILNNGRFN